MFSLPLLVGSSACFYFSSAMFLISPRPDAVLIYLDAALSYRLIPGHQCYCAMLSTLQLLSSVSRICLGELAGKWIKLQIKAESSCSNQCLSTYVGQSWLFSRLAVMAQSSPWEEAP